MKTIFYTFFLLFFYSTFSQEKSKPTYNQITEQAKKENKRILLYFSGSDWCAPCVKFKRFFIETEQFKTFTQNNILVYNADFPRQKKNKLPKDIDQQNVVLAEKI